MNYAITLLFLICCDAFINDEGPEVKILQGVLRGKIQESRKGRSFSAFTGIPYAQPPVGDLRFKPPVPASPWEGTLDASKPHAVCPQSDLFTGNFSTVGTEDCLFLNVYTPKLPDSSKSLLPVLFYIHGGAFIIGSANPTSYGPDVLLDKDIVLVTTNYRLGALGFITTGDEVVPGNNGLKDQNLALKWVKSNIAAFAGDPERITVVGNSAGAASTHLHVVSPLSRDLLYGAIAQSGSALGAWAVGKNDVGVEKTKRLAEFLNCTTKSNLAMVNCLRNAEAYEIVKQDIKYWEWAVEPMIVFQPVVEPKLEGAFLSEYPVDIIKSGKAANIPFMTGITTDDGALKASGYYSNPSWIEDIDKDFNRVVPISLQYGTEKGNITTKLRKFYFGDKKIDNTTKDELAMMYTDILFLNDADESVRLHSQNNDKPVFYYLFGYRGSESHSKLWGDSSYNYGVCHEDELLYLFSQSKEFPNYKPTEADEKMTEVLTTLWANFVTTGNPTPEINSVISTKWEPVQGDNLEYYYIKSGDELEMAEGLFSDRVNFIRELDLYSKRTVY